MTTNTIDDRTREALATLAPVREGLYRFLAAAFSSPPVPEQIARLRDAIENPALRERLPEELTDRLRACLPDGQASGADVAALRQEFMDLFKVPGGRYVTPYESVYRDEREVAGKPVRGLLCGPSSVAVRRWYRLAALEISPEYRDLPDHIAMELAYLAHLCAKEQQFAEAQDRQRLRRCWEMEHGFLLRHLTAWLPELRDRIHDRASHAYYPAISDLAVVACDADCRIFAAALGPAPADDLPD